MAYKISCHHYQSAEAKPATTTSQQQYQQQQQQGFKLVEALTESKVPCNQSYRLVGCIESSYKTREGGGK